VCVCVCVCEAVVYTFLYCHGFDVMCSHVAVWMSASGY